MPDVGFWKLAQQDPSRIAGDHGRGPGDHGGGVARRRQPDCPRPARAGPRPRRHHRRDPRQRGGHAAALPGGVAGGLLPHADQHAPHCPRDRVHPRELRRQGRLLLRARGGGDARAPTPSPTPPTRASRPATRPRLPRPFAALKEGQPATLPADRAAGATMTYTSGTTGQPKGVRRPLSRLDPTRSARRNAMFLMLFGIQPRGGRAPRRLAALPHGRPQLLHEPPPLRAHRGPHGQVDGRGHARSDRPPPRHAPATWCRRSSGACSRCPRRSSARADVSSLRHMIHSAAPCPVDVKRQMIEWWGDVI